VFLYDIDDLEAVVRENTKNREQELSFCHQIIAARTAALMEKYNLPFGKKSPDAVELLPGWFLGGATA
jgi:hypothetical protein